MKNTWGEARAICKSYDYELTTFETLIEAKTFFSMVDHANVFKKFDGTFFLIDGTTLTPKSATDWYWTKSRKKIQFSIPWLPQQPDFGYNLEYCFSFGRRNGSENFGFNDIRCYDAIYHFVCQKIKSFKTLLIPLSKLYNT